MYNESYLTNDCFPKRNRKQVCVQPIDVVKSYTNDHQKLIMAVSVLDLYGEPVPRSEVDIVVSSPGGFSFSIAGSTDSQGVALFELNRIAMGRWEAVVFDIRHPEFEVDLTPCEKRWSVIYV